jgi:hypothetical protein
MTGANSRTFRLYCAKHVLQEVLEHSERWAFECRVSHDAFLECWEREFLPLLRLVETRSLRELLSPKERERIDQLPDQDDAPSAMLALTIGAFFLTEDGDARFAVYGVDANSEERRRWLAPLMSGGDAAELWKFILTATAVPTLTMGGIWKLGRWLYERSPWTLGAAVASAMFLAMRISRENYRRIGEVFWQLSTYFVDGIIVPYNQSIERFNTMAPPIPSWADMVTTNERDAVLSRACLHQLARSRKSPMSARQLATELRTLGIGQGEKRVREILRRGNCFFEPYNGQWQLGRAIITAPE